MSEPHRLTSNPETMHTLSGLKHGLDFLHSQIADKNLPDSTTQQYLAYARAVDRYYQQIEEISDTSEVASDIMTQLGDISLSLEQLSRGCGSKVEVAPQIAKLIVQVDQVLSSI